MKLKKLEISEIPSYRPNAGQYEGKAHFADERGDVALNLTSEHVERIFQVCADGIIDTARRAAKDMTCAVIEQRELASLAVKS